MHIVSREQGFTLLELVFVVMIFVVLTSLTMPLFSRTLKECVRKNNMEDILSLMTFARERAVMEQQDYGIHFDAEKKAYWMIRRNKESFDSTLLRVPEKWGQTRTISSDVELQSNAWDLLFHPDGTSTSLTMDWIVPGQGTVASLHVNPILGEGSIVEKS